MFTSNRTRLLVGSSTIAIFAVSGATFAQEPGVQPPTNPPTTTTPTPGTTPPAATPPATTPGQGTQIPQINVQAPKQTPP